MEGWLAGPLENTQALISWRGSQQWLERKPEKPNLSATQNERGGYRRKRCIKEIAMYDFPFESEVLSSEVLSL